MPLYLRRILCAMLIAVASFAVARGLASAASERPNQLDRRVDAIPAAALLSQPAIALVDSARQEAARRRVDLMLPGWVLMVVFEAVALAYFWGSGAAAGKRAGDMNARGSYWLLLPRAAALRLAAEEARR